jgi:hypothetical protein
MDILSVVEITAEIKDSMRPQNEAQENKVFVTQSPGETAASVCLGAIFSFKGMA